MADILQNTRLKVIELNARSIVSLNRRHELNSFLKQNNPDVLLLCETNLKANHRAYFKNYKFHHDYGIPSTLKRGTGILLKEKISHTVIDARCWGLTSIECTAIQIQTESRPLSLVVVYRNPSDNSNVSFIEDLNKICRALHPTGPFVIGGDLNAHHNLWHDKRNCRHGTLLADWLQQSIITFNIKLECANEPTCYSRTSQSHIDLFLVSETLNVDYSPALGDSLEIADFPSDHRAVVLPILVSSRPIRGKLRTFINYAKADWKALRRQVDQSVEFLVPKNRIMNQNEIDEAVSNITSLVNDAVAVNIPSAECRQNSLIKLPQDVIDLIEHKNRLRRRWQRTRYNQGAHQLKSEINNLTKIIYDRIRIAHASHWTETLKNIKMNNNVFRNINKITARVTHKPIPTLKTANGSAETSQEKAESLANHFELVHNTNVNIGDQNRTNTINADVAASFLNNHSATFNFNQFEPADPTVKFHPTRHIISTKGLAMLIKHSSRKKSCGNDNISNQVIRKLGKRFIAAMATLFNQAFNIGYFPNAWKMAKIIAVQKKDKPPVEINSYRPISLLPCISKIFERIICNELNHTCSLLKLLPDDQFGFRADRSTVHPLAILQKDVITNFLAKCPTIAVAIDIQKAFDTTWIEGLIYKMAYNFNIDFNLCRIIHNYMINRTFSVQIDTERSTQRHISAGVPQGGVLSATLYILYVSDMPTPPQHINPIKRLQFADDILLYVSTRNLQSAKHRLEEYIGSITAFLLQWKLLCNPEKCEAIVFKSIRAMNTPAVNANYKKISIRIDNATIIPASRIKYLGVILERSARHTRHVDQSIRKAKSAIGMIRPILRKVDGLDKNIKTMLYKTLIRPILSYAFPCWSNVTSSQMERIRLAERACLRLCTSYRRDAGSRFFCNNAELYRNATIDRIDIFMTTAAIKFFEKCRTAESPLIKTICSPEPDAVFETTPKIKPPDHIMHLNDAGVLFVNGKLMHYHRRYGRQDDPVYPTGQ